MRLLQLSDLHVRCPGNPLAGRVETLPYLERAVTFVERMLPEPDAIIVTGDVADQMETAEYELARGMLRRLRRPCFALPGNHDSRRGMRELLPFCLREPLREDCLAYVVEQLPLRLVMLDSVIPGHGDGRLGGDQLAWLDSVLAAAPSSPSLLAVHHPPFETGIGFMDRIGLNDRAALGEVVARHGQVVGIVAGHVHRTIVGSLAGRVALTAPSVAHQIPLDLSPDGPDTFVLEPPGFLLHEWDGTSLRSHHGYLGDFGAWHRFDEGTDG
ncbi:MAG TPA: phosphodiesterase [Gemmatimonadales bacterium]|nr:phosphodiesterase [Gemmatimonadales bacterium]